MDFKNVDLYKILQVSPDASIEVINVAYSTLARKYHPSAPEGDLESYEMINYAFEILCNPVTRKEYDSKRLNFGNTELPPVFPVFEKEVLNLQSLINMLYENINYESVSHNPTKSRIYQEIYDEILKSKNKIEDSDADNNPIWKILKTYRPYLNEEEFNSLKKITAQVLNISDNEADKILTHTGIDDIPYKKIYPIIVIVFIASILGIGLAYFIFTKPESFNNFFNSQTAPGNDVSAPGLEDQKFTYFARIINIGMPVNIRSSPTIEWDNQVAKVNPGEIVEVIKHQPNGWYYIKKDDIEGYIYGGLLENNDYPDAYSIGQIIPGELKVFNKNKKPLYALKEGDRLVIFYHNNDNYYLVNEKGELIETKKTNIMLDNKQKTAIPYIEDKIRDSIEFFALSTEQFIIEDTNIDTIPENNIDDQAPTEPTEIPEEETNISEPFNTPQIKPDEPEILFPGNTSRNSDNINAYLADLKRNILTKWKVPAGLDSYGTVVHIKVGKDGQLLNLNLVKSSGSVVVDEESIKAVKYSAPFKPLPASYNKDSIDIQFNFDEK